MATDYKSTKKDINNLDQPKNTKNQKRMIEDIDKLKEECDVI